MKRGFTLIETVVTVGIVAAMAAIVIPQVARQFDAADPARIQNDLKNIQAAIEVFNSNVRSLPGDIDDLANQIAVTADSTTSSTAGATPTFTAGEVALWTGPYLDIGMPDGVNLDRVLPTAIAARILDSFVCYSAGNDQHGVSDSTKAGANATNDQSCPAVSGQTFLAVQLIGIPCNTASGTSFMTLNALFDGANEPIANLSGRVRCASNGVGFATLTDRDVVYYLAVPIS